MATEFQDIRSLTDTQYKRIGELRNKIFDCMFEAQEINSTLLQDRYRILGVFDACYHLQQAIAAVNDTINVNRMRVTKKARHYVDDISDPIKPIE